MLIKIGGHEEMKKSLLSTAVSIAVATAAFPYAALAQDAGEGDRLEEEVVVTGSRIARTNLTANTAINIIDTEKIELSGAINTAELLEALPASGVATFASTTGNFDVQNSGVNTIELRNLDEDRTLVLVNGRRFVAGVPGEQSVDFNSIPTEFIERIDVVTGGASAIYGSDALAGVVNIILKDSFDGFQVSAQSGLSDVDDDETHRITMTGGFDFDDDRGNAMMSVTFDKETGVFARNRENLGVDGVNSVFFTGDPNDYDAAVVPFLSSFSEKGRFVVPDRSVVSGSADLVLDDDGTVRAFRSDEDGFNRQQYRALSVPTERLLVSGVMNYQVNDNINWFAEMNYSGVETSSELEPFPFSSDDVYGDNAADCFDTDGDGVNDDCSFGMPLMNPYVPEDMRVAARIANPGVADDNLVLGFARRTTELDPRGADNLRQTFRIVSGIDGSFLDDFNYELSMNYGRTTQDQKSSGQINVLNMRYALDAVYENPDDPENSAIICRDEIARLQGCLPVNLFGTGSITAGLSERERDQMLQYLQANSSTASQVEQAIVSGFVSGPLFELPGGMAMFSAGAEYRDEQSESIADGLSQQGLNAGNVTPPTIGGFDVSEFYAEAVLPVLADQPGAQLLELQLAARFSDYSTVGNTTAYAASGRYEPNEDLMFRSQYSRAVRAPNISELFEPLTETFEGGDDPCEGVTRTAGGEAAFLNIIRDTDNPQNALGSGVNGATVGDPVAVSCIQDPTIDQRVDETGGLVLTQSEIQGVGGFNGGAAAGGQELIEETADTFTLGVVWSPAAIESLNISIDYFNIEIEDAIDALERQDSLDNCYSGGGFDASSDFCTNIVRFDSGPSVGALREINALQQNIAEIKTEGIDIQVNYDFDLGDAGLLQAVLTWTHLLTYEEVPFEGSDTIDFTGEVGYAEDKAVLGWTYRLGPAVVAFTTEWIGKSELSNDPNNAFFGAAVSDRFFHDIQARYEVVEDVELVFGMDNITDEFVRIEQSGPDVPTGWNTRPDVYDSLGRRYYAGIKAKF